MSKNVAPEGSDTIHCSMGASHGFCFVLRLYSDSERAANLMPRKSCSAKPSFTLSMTWGRDFTVRVRIASVWSWSRAGPTFSEFTIDYPWAGGNLQCTPRVRNVEEHQSPRPEQRQLNYGPVGTWR